MIECNQTEEAKRYALMALEQSRQIQAERSLQRLVVVLQKAVRIEQQIGLKGYAARLFELLDEGRFNLMLMRETVPGAACNPVIVAFSCYLFKSIRDLGFERLASSIDSMASLTLDRASREKRTVYRALMQVLCGAPREVLAETAESWRWRMPWERGLVDVLFHAANSGMESPFARTIETEITSWPSTLPFEFCEHAGNVKYGLCYQLIGSIDGSNEFINSLRTEASDRAEDEILSAAKWLLQIPSSNRGIPPAYYVWTFLRETVLKATYFPWETEITYSARKTLFNENVQRSLEAITA